MPHDDPRDPYIIYHAGDTRPPLRYQVTEAENQAIGDADPIDLTTVEEVRIGVVNDEGLVVNDTVDIVSPSQGIVEYEFEEEQIGATGSYYAEFRVLHTLNDPETFPKERDLWIKTVPSNFDGEAVTGVPQSGEVDTLDARIARIGEGFYAPVYADLANAPKQLGNIVYADGSGTSTEGVYRYNGAEFDNFENATDAFVSDDGIEVVNSLAELDARSGLAVTDLGNGAAGLDVDLEGPITENVDNQLTDSEEVTTAEKPSYDVTYYGAEGDGATDDTAAIQSAIDAAIASGGGTIYFPSGTYVISDELVVGDSIAMKGDGRDATTIETEQSGDGAQFPGAMIAGTDVSNFHLEGISFFGPGINAASGSMLYFDRVDQGNVPNISVESVFGEGFAASNAFAINTPIMCYLRNLRVQKVAGSGIGAFGGGTSLNLDNCYTLTCTDAGFDFTTITYSTLRGCAAEGCGVGYDFDTLRNSAIVGCGAEENFYRSDSHPGIHYRFTNGGFNELTASYARGFSDAGDLSQLTYIEADNTELSIDRFRGVYENNPPADDYRILNGADVEVIEPYFQGPGRSGEPVYERDGGDVVAQTTDTGEVLLEEYASATDAPAGSGVGIVGVTDDGHLLMEDGQ
jgi:hypothetical protein